MCPLLAAISSREHARRPTQTPVAFMFIPVADVSDSNKKNIDQDDNVFGAKRLQMQQQKDNLNKTPTTSSYLTEKQVLRLLTVMGLLTKECTCVRHRPLHHELSENGNLDGSISAADS